MAKHPAAVALGKLGGAATSDAKAAAARANASRPRPNAKGKKKPRQRYCEMCDAWGTAKACHACGADTQPAAKEAQS